MNTIPNDGSSGANVPRPQARLPFGADSSIRWAATDHQGSSIITNARRANGEPTMSKSSRGVVVWFTGLSGAGKSTLAEALAPELRASGKRVEVLDGDVVRTHLSKGLSFSREDRDLNVARIAFVAHLLARNGVAVLVAAISPFRAARDAARAQIGDFVEVHVAPPLEECVRRDVKGLYQKALAGEIAQFTGVNDPYEAPLSAEVTIDTSNVSLEAGVNAITATLRTLGYLATHDEPACSVSAE
jgi:adenylyl-sulfate kinase